ncbi:glycosyltransferase family 2 protein [Nocardioides sp. 616]|uniref:glycosyltransferase family 2 protein n=1 Tax=Nocardioides sp. 616 TaxID=2268090 RepID=UPI000CE3D71F|nr:glycosyltransferase family 2 protein [Nocardioides sp. 616]
MLDILLPYWGDPELLRAAVRSVLAQTDPDWRLVVVDDHYPDEAVGPWVEGLGDPRVHYVRNETNLGITDNYRRCLDLTTADWMVFFGCDDLMLPHYVETVHRAIATAPDEVDIVQPGVVIVDEHGAPSTPLVDRAKRRLFAPRVEQPLVLGGEELAASLLRGNWLYWPSLAFRADRLRKHDFLDDFPLIQDLAVIVDMILTGSRMLVLPEVCFAYRRHSASASSATVTDGGRFARERAYFDLAGQRCATAGMPRAARAARRHTASRLYAASVLPTALRARSWPAVRSLGRHVLQP